MINLTFFRYAGPELIDRLVRQSPAQEAVIRELAALDPSAPKYTFLQWMLKQYKTVPDVKRIADAVRDFMTWRHSIDRFDTQDIGPLSLMEVEDRLHKKDTSVEQVYAKGGWRVLQVPDREAMCDIGDDRWCVAWKDKAGRWDTYVDEYPGVEFFMFEGPTNNSPYLVAVVDDQLVEVKNKGNAVVDDDDPVHAVIQGWRPDMVPYDAEQARQYRDTVLARWDRLLQDRATFSLIGSNRFGDEELMQTDGDWFVVKHGAAGVRHLMQSWIADQPRQALVQAATDPDPTAAEEAMPFDNFWVDYQQTLGMLGRKLRVKNADLLEAIRFCGVVEGPDIAATAAKLSYTHGDMLGIDFKKFIAENPRGATRSMLASYIRENT